MLWRSPRCKQGNTLRLMSSLGNSSFANHVGTLDAQRAHLESLHPKLGIKTMDDWYKVRQVTLQGAGVSPLLNLYSNTKYLMLKTLYPDHEWLPWRFKPTPKGFWNDIGNQKQYFNWVAKQLNVESLEGWYNIDSTEVYKLYGKGLLDHKYNSSLIDALSTVYSNHQWKKWRFNHCPRGFWTNMNNQKEFFDGIGRELGVVVLEDWYRVHSKQVAAQGGGGLLDGYYDFNLAKALKTIYPDHTWETHRFSPMSTKKEFQAISKCAEATTISPIDLKDRLGKCKKTLLLDMRPETQFQISTIPQAKLCHIEPSMASEEPLKSFIAENFDSSAGEPKGGEDKDILIVLFSDTDDNVANLCDYLPSFVHRYVAHLEGGIIGWVNAKGAIVSPATGDVVCCFHPGSYPMRLIDPSTNVVPLKTGYSEVPDKYVVRDCPYEDH